MKEGKLRDLVDIAIVTALYVGLTLATYPLSYGNIQFRISECLVLLTYFNKKYGIGVTLGVLIANFFNPQFAVVDMIFGTLSTAIACILICFSKHLFVSAVWPVLTSTIVVIEVWYMLGKTVPFWLCFVEIVGSMAVIDLFIGYFTFRILMKNQGFLKAIHAERPVLKGKSENSMDEIQ